MRFLPEQRKVTAAVVGLGYVGSAVAATLASRGVEIVGIDTDQGLIDELKAGHCRFSEPGLPEMLLDVLNTGTLRVTTDCSVVSTVDVIIVTVGTPITAGGYLADDQLKSACAELSGHLRTGQLLLFKSTVPPGGTRELVVPILESGGLRCGLDFGLAFCPERLAEGVALRELATSPIVVGGWSAESTEAAAAFWRSGIGTEVIRCSSMEAAELVKLANNWWIDHNIALANELATLCSTLEVDVLDVISAANSIPKGSGRVNILLPSVGVGGSCLTKDPWMVWRAAKERGVDLHTIPVARDVNDAMPGFTADLIAAELAKVGKSVADARIAVLGLAFKNNTGDLRATPTRPVVARLRESGARVRVFDPLVDAEAARTMFGVAPAPTVLDAVAGADCIAVLARHDEFDTIDFGALREHVATDCLVLDGRAYYPPETIDKLRRHGFTYRGIGR